jgi:hypothetical protein
MQLIYQSHIDEKTVYDNRTRVSEITPVLRVQKKDLKYEKMD